MQTKVCFFVIKQRKNILTQVRNDLQFNFLKRRASQIKVILVLGKYRTGKEYAIGATNIGCDPMFSWCPSKDAIEFFKWERRSDYNVTTDKCAYLEISSTTSFRDAIVQSNCFSPKEQQYICMSK
jgi:hypothetical protein